MWRDKNSVKGVLLDVTGVLYESGNQVPIPGSVEAVNKILQAGLPVRLVTNETLHTPRNLLAKLKGLGYEGITEDQIFAPSVAARRIINDRNLRPYLLVHPNLLPDFEGCDTSNPNCVVVGDAADNFTYENVNTAFRVLLQSPILISMGKGKYYREKGELVLDLGAYTAALEYACSIKAEIIGKPNGDFFMAAVNSMGLSPDKVVMVGDDLAGDIGGAQAASIKAILVRTGKYRPQDETHLDLKPDLVVNNLEHFVTQLLS